MTDREKEIYWKGYNDALASKKENCMRALLSKQDKIQNIVCDYFDIKIENIRERKRAWDVRYPRQILTYFLSVKTTMGCVRIARVVNQDHTSVLHSVKQIKDLMQTDAGVAKDIQMLEGILRAAIQVAVVPPMLMDKIKKIELGERVVGENEITFFHRAKPEYSNTGHLDLLNRYSEVS